MLATSCACITGKEPTLTSPIVVFKIYQRFGTVHSDNTGEDELL